jgi:hypothetical protein
MEFLVHVVVVADRPRDFALDDVSKTAAEPVNRDFHRAFVQT